MQNFKKQYKNPPLTFGDATRIKTDLVCEQQKRRKKIRTENFEENRKDSPCSPAKIDEVKKKLSEWKSERERKKKEKSQKKPPFIVGVVRHRVYSPIMATNVSISNTVKETTVKKTTKQAHKNSTIKRGITGATKKRLLAKAENAAKQKMPENSVAEKSPTNEIKSGINTRESFAPPNHKFNPPAGLSPIYKTILIDVSPSKKNTTLARDESTKNVTITVPELVHSIEKITLKVSFNEQETFNFQREERINSTEKSILNNNNVKTSPLGTPSQAFAIIEKESYVANPISSTEHLSNAENNISGNKQNNPDLRKISPSDELPIKDAIKGKNPDISMEGKEYTAEYFKDLSYKERNRLQKLCDKWTRIQSQDNISEDARYRINQAIGQTTLLIKKKFKQFHALILDCEKGKGDVLVTCTDLHGFWDMMYIEVKDCDSRFAKLENFRARNWQEKQSSLVQSGSRKKKIGKKQIVSVRRSLSREFISADKEKQMAEIQDSKCSKENLQQIVNINNGCITPSMSDKNAIDALEKNFNVSHRDRSILEICTNHVYTSTPILDNIKSSIPNQLSTPFITMKVNRLYNKSTMQLNDTISYAQTPKSNITEKKKKLRTKSLGIKSPYENNSKHVILTKLFNEKSKTVPKLKASSKKINNLEFDELNSQERFYIERKSSSSDSSPASYETVFEKTLIKENEKKE